MTSLTTRYDYGSDVLYITHKIAVATKGIEDQYGIVWRYADGELIGATVLDFFDRWSHQKALLANKLASKFNFPQQEALSLVRELMDTARG